MTCTRRPHAVWTTCRCDTCRTDMARHRKRHAAGLCDCGSSAQATVTIIGWLRAGYTPAWIATATGIPTRAIDAISADFRRAGKRTIGPKRARMILAADITTGTAGKCPAEPLTRRVQALHRLGWDGATIAATAGISPQMVSYLGNRRVQYAGPAINAGIRAAYAALGSRPGPSQIAVARAVRNGWASPAAWDDIDRDEAPIGIAS